MVEAQGGWGAQTPGAPPHAVQGGGEARGQEGGSEKQENQGQREPEKEKRRREGGRVSTLGSTESDSFTYYLFVHLLLFFLFF